MEPPPLAAALALFAEGRVAEAIGILQQRAGAGDPEALFALGDVFWRGVGVVQDYPRGRALFAMASEAGDATAARAVTNLLASGIAGPRDWPLALRRLEAEARSDGRRAEMLALIRRMALTGDGDPLWLPDQERLADRPDIRLFRDALTAAECDFLIRVAEPTYEPSKVVAVGGGLRVPLRTSDGSTLHWLIEDPATHALNRRLAALSGTRWDQGEPLQILRYRPGQQYRPHVDWLDEANPRVLTALAWLNDDYEGGETAFAKAGLTVRGRAGDVLVFRSEAPGGGLDPLSEHAGLPVTAGTKYLASRWIRAGRHAV
ncbi:MAG: 2OG-Fe(II) oxygenase [Alphaproteobacteria bacterium]|nr:2OG-Fe(II) oxygenase [Alphaproteobacteria bacterium]